MVDRIFRFRGDTIPDGITVTGEDGVVPTTLATYQFTMTLNKRKNPVTIADQVWQIAGVLMSPTTGLVEFAPSPAQVDIPVGTYYIDVQAVDALGRKETILKIPYEIVQDVTKA